MRAARPNRNTAKCLILRKTERSVFMPLKVVALEFFAVLGVQQARQRPFLDESELLPSIYGISLLLFL